MSVPGRRALSLLLAAWVIATTWAATQLLLKAESRIDMACRILNNAWVPTAPAVYPECPLEPYERIDSIRVDGGVRRVNQASDIFRDLDPSIPVVEVRAVKNGERRWVDVPLVEDGPRQRFSRAVVAWLAVGLIQALSLAILSTSSTTGVRPFALFFTCVSVVLLWFLAGYDSSLLNLLARPGYSMLPATAFHIALTFPRRREIVRKAPGILAVPYLVSLALLVVGYATVDRSPVVWALADRLVFVLTCVAASMCVVSCFLAVRESESRIERARARLLLYGTALAFCVPVAIELSLGESVPGASMLLPILGVTMIPAFVGYGIARYHLFHLGGQIRRVVARAAFVTAVAGLMTAVVVGLDPGHRVTTDTPLLYLAFFGVLVTTELLRFLFKRVGGDMFSPQQGRLLQEEERYGREIEGAFEPLEIVGAMGDAVRNSLFPAWMSIFVIEDGVFVLGYATGAQSLLDPTAEWMDELERSGRIRRLVVEEGELTPALHMLVDHDVEIVLPISRGEELLGVALVAARMNAIPYDGNETSFLIHLAAQCGAAIVNARLTSQAVISERYAAVGRVEANLVHEIGKPLGVMQIHASKLAARLPLGTSEGRLACAILSLGTEMREIIRALACAADGATQDVPRFDPADAVRVAIDRVVRFYPGRQIGLRRPTYVPKVRGEADQLSRAVGNLVENAVLASEADDGIDVSLHVDASSLRIEVADTGCGMGPESLGKVFDPFYSTRDRERGTGLGLPIAADLIDRLGGEIRIDSVQSVGTKVTVELPLPGGVE